MKREIHRKSCNSTLLEVRHLGLFFGVIGMMGCTTQIIPLGSPLDSGGHLQSYIAEVRRLNAEASTKAIRGVCVSACTIYLGVKNVCVDPTAQVWFHAAHLPGDNRPNSLGSLEMLSYYPPSVRAWAIRTRALESTDLQDAKKLTGEQLIRMGVRSCLRLAPASSEGVR
jgi:hypothetical protein